MENKEFAVGEVFQFGLKKLKTVELPEGSYDECAKCELIDICLEFPNGILSHDLVGGCTPENRSDGKGVVFVEVKEKNQ